MTHKQIYTELNEIKQMLFQVKADQKETSNDVRDMKSLFNGNGKPGIKTRLALIEKSVAERESFDQEKRRARLSTYVNMFLFVVQSIITVFLIGKLKGL